MTGRWRDIEYIPILLGKIYEMTVQERAPAIFGKKLKGIKVVWPRPSEIVEKLENAVTSNHLTEEEKQQILNLDLIVKGKDKETGKIKLLAVEVSYTLDADDIQRAQERAALLKKALKMEVEPVVVSAKITESQLNKKPEGIEIILYSLNKK
jgi:hypothetical protein